MKQKVYQKNISFRTHLADFTKWYFENVKKWDTLKNIRNYIGQNVDHSLKIEKMNDRHFGQVLNKYQIPNTFEHDKYCHNGKEYIIWALKGHLPSKTPNLRGNPHRWNEKEVQYLIANYQNMNDTAIGNVLNRSKLGVGKKRRELGLLTVNPALTHKADPFIRTHFDCMTDAQMAESLDTSKWAIVMRRRELKLYRTKLHGTFESDVLEKQGIGAK